MEGLFLLFILGAFLVTFRLVFMGNKTPEFAPSDNPASDSDSLLTKLLTFNTKAGYYSVSGGNSLDVVCENSAEK